MTVLSPQAHGVLDYITGASLLALAAALASSEDGERRDSSILHVAGTTILAQAVLTDYKPGLIKVLPFRLHLGSDYLLAATLAASPVMLGFRDKRRPKTWVPHLLIGLTILGVTLITRSEPEKEKHWVMRVLEIIRQIIG